MRHYFPLVMNVPEGDTMSAPRPRRPTPDHLQELLHEALEETFPASDPPALVEPGGGISGAEESPRDTTRRDQLGKRQQTRRPGT
jgi:hypothetical protein